MSALLHEMTVISAQVSLARSMQLNAGLIRLTGLLIDRYMAYKSDYSEMSADIRINNLIAYMQSNPSWMPSVSGLAELVQLSESHLRKLFQQYVGMPPQSFIHRVKIEQAKKMLVESDERISGIAAHLGFHNPNYFARLFRKHAAASPKMYREAHYNWMTGTLPSD